MGYTNEYLLPKLKHVRTSDAVQYRELSEAIWYAISKESYIQRDNSFDGTWFSSHASDYYVAYALLRFLKLKEIYVFSKAENCHGLVDSLTEPESDNILAIYNSSSSSESLFYAFFEFLRNAYAHGTFNTFENGTLLAINQPRPKENAPVKAYLHTRGRTTLVSDAMHEFIQDLTDISGAKKKYLAGLFGKTVDPSQDYIILDDAAIVIDDNFVFASDKKTIELRELIEKHAAIPWDKRIYIIVQERISSFAERNLTSPDGRVRIISIEQLAKHFSVDSVHMREDKQ